jgi:hypothetical protein
MPIPADWQNPITAAPGQTQQGVDPTRLLPGRSDLIGARVEAQRALLLAGRKRFTPITVSPSGVIYDGHHAVRAAAEEGIMIDVRVVDVPDPSVGLTILELPVR